MLRANTTSMSDLEFVNHSQNTEFTVITFGYYMPVIICISIVLNFFMVIVLLKKGMRSPTNLFVAGIATAEILTCLFPLPVLIHVYGLGHHRDYIEYNSCRFVDYCGIILPTMMHTVATWLTLGMLIQRTITVRCSKRTRFRHDNKPKVWCNIYGSILGISTVYILAVILHIFKFYEFSYESVEAHSKLDKTKTIQGCRKSSDQNSSLAAYFDAYPFVYLFCVQLIPYILMVVLTVYLTKGNCCRRRRPKKKEKMQVTIVNYTTNKVVFVVAVFLVSKLPNTILISVLIFDYYFGFGIYSDHAIIRLTYLAFLIFTSPLNFVIYCSLSRTFLMHLRRLFSKK